MPRRLRSAARACLVALFSITLALIALPALAQGPALARPPAQQLPPPPGAQVTIPRAAPPTARPPVPAPPARDDRAFAPWWQSPVQHSVLKPSRPLDMTLENVVLGTLMHSPRVRVMTDVPIIRRSNVLAAEAAFDVNTFMESRITDTSDPVGSTLTTGGAPRFIDQNAFYSAGARRQTSTGASVEVSERIGYEGNNSIYFVPPNQGNARLTLNVTQPLLNGAGVAYNTSTIVLAQIDTNIARDQLAKELQTLLLEVHRAYWDLYLQRSVLLQRRKLHQDAISILNELNARREVDVLGNQIVRAKAAVAMREAATIRYATAVRNAESRLRALINDPMLSVEGATEMIPAQSPTQAYLKLDLRDSLIAALRARPDINQATKEIRACSVRADVSANEILPVLNMIVGTYASGLHGDTGIPQAFGDQFSEGRPTYWGGLLFERSYCNRAANARLQQRRLELRLATNQLQVIIANVRAEVEIAVREVETSYREMVSRYHAMAADQTEIEYLTERWRLLPGDAQVAGVVLDNLLSAQDRLALAEFDFATAEVEYNLAMINERRVTGTLLDYEEITQTQTVQSGLPTLMLGKREPNAPPVTELQMPPQSIPPLPGAPRPTAPQPAVPAPGPIPEPVTPAPGPEASKKKWFRLPVPFSSASKPAASNPR